MKKSSLLSKMIVPFCLGAIGGVFSASLFGWQAAPFVVLIFWIVWLVFFSRRLLFLGMLLLGLVLGFLKTDQEIRKIDVELPAEFSGEVVVVGDPTVKEDYQKIVTRPLAEQYSKVKFITFQPLYPKYEAAQKLRVGCQLERPENKDEKFDYIRYLAKDDVYRICKKASLEPLGFDENSRTAVLGLREAIEQKIEKLLPQPEAPYLAGLLLGGSDRLPVDVAEAFRRTGTTHVVAVSGYNITIVASVVTAFLLFLGMWRKRAFWFSVLGIAFFVLLVGSPTSAVRAAIMAILVLWAARNGRLASSGRALLLAASGMILWSPLILVYDVGFQLSFLATIGIVYIYGPLSEKLKISNDFLELKSILLVTFAAQAAVTGIIIYQFGTFSPFSLLVNFIILPLVPVIMLFGFVMTVLSFISMSLASYLSWGVWALLHFEIKIIEIFSRIPHASISIENIGVAWLVGYYVFITGLIIYLQKRPTGIEKQNEQ